MKREKKHDRTSRAERAGVGGSRDAEGGVCVLQVTGCQQTPGREFALDVQQQERGEAPRRQEIVVLCSPLLSAWIDRSFSLMISEQRLPARVTWSGHSCRYEQGIVVIAWNGVVSPDFLEQLEIDTDVIDYVIYDTPVCCCDRVALIPGTRRRNRERHTHLSRARH